MADFIYHATTVDGMNLPIVDVTSPAFAVTVSDVELASLSDGYVLESRRRGTPAPQVIEALGRSLLGRGLLEASGTFLAGLSTYLLKLGPDNLPAGAGDIDRRIAASFPALTTRLRLQDMVRLLADGLTPMLRDAPARPLALVNLAAGVAADSWNALIMLRHAGLLSGRSVSVAAMDPDEAGPAFARRALSTLAAAGAPLDGVAVAFRHALYDWSDANPLLGVLRGLSIEDTLCAVSSEGGLFEYASDEAVVANLQVIHACTAADAIIVGSTTREGEPVRASQAGTGISTRPRTIDAFDAIVRQAGWEIGTLVERPFSYHVCLHKARR